MYSGDKFLGLVMIGLSILVVYRVAPYAAIAMAVALIVILALLSSPFRHD